ncbi:hypothetical protein D3C72_2456930 [compost metagenome]
MKKYVMTFEEFGGLFNHYSSQTSQPLTKFKEKKLKREKEENEGIGKSLANVKTIKDIYDKQQDVNIEQQIIASNSSSDNV